MKTASNVRQLRERIYGVPHRLAVAAADKVATVTPTAAKNDNITGVMAASAHYYAVAPGNKYGPVTPTKGAGTITPTLNKTVDLTIAQVDGAEWYDIFFSTDAEPKFVGRITEAMRANGCAITAVGTAAAIYQAETATAAGTISGAGNAKAVVTANGMAESPKTITFAVAVDDTAAQWAAKCRTALAADAAVSALFTVSGADQYIILTKKAGAANDATLNIALDNDTSTGITTAATSANTTWGIDPGKCNVRLIGTGVATNAVPFTTNNAYRPELAREIDCTEAEKAYIYPKLNVTDLRSAPTLIIVPFLKNGRTGEWSQGTAITVTLLTAVNKPLAQYAAIDVHGATGLVVLVEAITGQGATVDIDVELAQ